MERDRMIERSTTRRTCDQHYVFSNDVCRTRPECLGRDPVMSFWKEVKEKRESERERERARERERTILNKGQESAKTTKKTW